MGPSLLGLKSLKPTCGFFLAIFFLDAIWVELEGWDAAAKL